MFAGPKNVAAPQSDPQEGRCMIGAYDHRHVLGVMTPAFQQGVRRVLDHSAYLFDGRWLIYR
jgi:hypothetical protein